MNIEDKPIISLIPRGLYCYEALDFDESTCRIKTKYCPFHRLHHDKPKQANGECTLFGIKDWEEEHLSLLWDSCKECGINEGLEDYDEEETK